MPLKVCMQVTTSAILQYEIYPPMILIIYNSHVWKLLIRNRLFYRPSGLCMRHFFYLLNSKQTTTLIPETNSSLEFAIKLVKFTHKIETAKHYNLYCSNDHQILIDVEKTQSNTLA